MIGSSGNNNEPDKKVQFSRRSFLKSGVAAAAMGVIGAVKAPSKIAEAAVNDYQLQYAPAKGQWSKLRPEANYGGAAVRHVEFNDQWIGTTKITGSIKNKMEITGGFVQAAMGKYGKKAQAGMFTINHRYPLNPALDSAIYAISKKEYVEGTPNPEKLTIPDPEQMSKHIKDLAYWLRADEVGIGRMPEFAYYSHKFDPFEDLMHGIAGPKTKLQNIPITERLPYVIVVAVEQHLETYLASNGYDGISNCQSYRSYHATAHIAVIMASYIRTLGYKARANHYYNYQAAMAPCLIAAGMGESTRTGDCVAHPRIGFRSKVAAVTTDLPLVPDKPIDFGMHDFCRVCKKCADNCPSGAITFDLDPVEYNGYLRWNSDHKKCTEFRTGNDEGVNCGRCIKVCPWNSKESSWFHEAGIWIGSKGEASSKLLKTIDDMFGYGTEQVENYKWWLEWPELYKFKY